MEAGTAGGPARLISAGPGSLGPLAEYDERLGTRAAYRCWHSQVPIKDGAESASYNCANTAPDEAQIGHNGGLIVNAALALTRWWLSAWCEPLAV